MGYRSRGVMELRERILTGSVVKTIFWLAWPMILANLVNISYNLVDAFWLGKLGRQAFGAPTVSWPLIMFFYSLGMGFAMAGISLISQYVGAGDLRMASRSAGNLMTLMGLMAVMISALGYVSAPYVLHLMGVPPDVYPLAVNYIRVIFIGIPFAFIGFAFITIANSLGDTRTPTLISIISSIFNMILDPILIFGWFGIPRMGVIGAALATILSRTLISVVGSYMLFHGYKGIRIGIHDLGIDGWWVRKVVSIGTPLAIQQSSNALGFTVMMGIVSRFGSVAIAAYGVAIRIIDVITAFTWGINRATSIMVGQNVGAELYERAKDIVKKSLMLVTAILATGSLAIYLIRDWAVAVFINEPNVVIEGSKLLSIFTLSIPFFGLFSVGGGVAAGSGHTRFFAIVSILRLWALRIGLSVLLGLTLGMGTMGVWIAMTLSNVGAGLLALAWVLRATWARRVIEEVKVKKVVSPITVRNNGKERPQH